MRFIFFIVISGFLIVEMKTAKPREKFLSLDRKKKLISDNFTLFSKILMRSVKSVYRNTNTI